MIFVFEGTDGAGKTTLMKKIESLLIKNQDVMSSDDLLITKEPGSPLIPINQDIRKAILNRDVTDEFLLSMCFTLDFLIHLKYMKDWQEDHPDGIILCDRSTAISDHVYRDLGGLDNIEINFINHARAFIFREFAKLNPVVFLILTDPEVAITRMNTRDQEKNRFEIDRVIPRMQKIYDGYKYMFSDLSFDLLSLIRKMREIAPESPFGFITVRNSLEDGINNELSDMDQAELNYISEANTVRVITLENNEDFEPVLEKVWESIRFCLDGKWEKWLKNQ